MGGYQTGDRGTDGQSAVKRTRGEIATVDGKQSAKKRSSVIGRRYQTGSLQYTGSDRLKKKWGRRHSPAYVAFNGEPRPNCDSCIVSLHRRAINWRHDCETGDTTKVSRAHSPAAQGGPVEVTKTRGWTAAADRVKAFRLRDLKWAESLKFVDATEVSGLTVRQLREP